ncbi:MAG: phospholipase D-like domain-containing protein [Candidatus Omnitrophota bacterium]
MKKYLMISLIALAMLGITAHPALIGIARVSPLWAKGFSYQADVEDISGAKYFPAVKEALEKAEKSINLVMFTIETPLEGKNSKVSQLIEALIVAKNRGVEVEVILDQNVDFVHRGHPSDWEVEIKSTRAFKRLKDAGIKVYYDEPARYTHCKTVIIDKKIVILGSTNWTESAFSNSIETDVMVNSAGLAEEILKYLKTIKIDESAEKNFEIIGPTTRIGWNFLENPGLAPQMVKMSAVRDFDVYLYLLWKFDEKKGDSPRSGTVPFLYEDMAKYLGIYEGWTATDYRRQIIRALRNLEQRYKLIRFEPRFAKEAVIILLNYEDSTKVYEIPGEIASGASRPRNDTEVAADRNDTGTPYFELTNDYFNFGWNRELFLRAKFCLLINVEYFQMSDVKPFWSESLPTLTKQFGGVSRDVIIKGMEELRRKKLIEVKYDELRGKPYDIKAPKMYKLLKLYDPKELDLKLKAIEDKYGREAYAKAMRYAEIIFEENNPLIVEDIILKTKQYGAEKIKEAFDIVAQKNTDNPKKSYAYVVGVLKKKAGEAGID